MNPDKGPLVNKLTLLVLLLMLVCLVLLVVRAYHKPLATGEPSAMAEAETVLAAVEESWPAPAPAPTHLPESPRRISATNTARVPLPPSRPPPPVNAAAPGAGASTPSPLADAPTALVNPFEGLQAANTVISGAGSSLFGWAILTGKPKEEVPIEMDAVCGGFNPRKLTTRHFVVSAERGLANVLVYVQNASPGPPLSEPPLLDQVGCMFEPYVLGMVAGQTFRIRNSDPTLHNVHATPKANRGFNFGQPLKGQVNEVSFPLPELFVRLKCDVHPWMFAYVNVLPHPFFAITDSNGVFRLPDGLPAGDYTVSAVHLKAGELTRQVTLGVGGARPLHFQFSATPGVQPQERVARQ